VLAQGHREGLKKGLEEGLEDGRAQGRVASILAVLEARGLRLGKAARERIEACGDVALLDRWVRRAATVAKTADLFDEPAR
jgi:hypothetical protein